MNLDNVVVFAAACDDCSGAISDSTLELLREHGLEAKFDESEGLSWYGVVANGHAEHEDCSDSLVRSYGGSLPNGDFFSLESLGVPELRRRLPLRPRVSARMSPSGMRATLLLTESSIRSRR